MRSLAIINGRLNKLLKKGQLGTIVLLGKSVGFFVIGLTKKKSYKCLRQIVVFSIDLEIVDCVNVSKWLVRVF